jgi:hypothetical protein
MIGLSFKAADLSIQDWHHMARGLDSLAETGNKKEGPQV